MTDARFEAFSKSRGGQIDQTFVPIAPWIRREDVAVCTIHIHEYSCSDRCDEVWRSREDPCYLTQIASPRNSRPCSLLLHGAAEPEKPPLSPRSACGVCAGRSVSFAPVPPLLPPLQAPCGPTRHLCHRGPCDIMPQVQQPTRTRSWLRPGTASALSQGAPPRRSDPQTAERRRTTPTRTKRRYLRLAGAGQAAVTTSERALRI